MKEKSEHSTLYQIIALISFIALVLLSLYSAIVCSFWIYKTRYDFISIIWEKSFQQILIFTDLTHIISFLMLLFSAIRAKTPLFEPSQILLYTIVLWITSSSFLVIETNPTRWDDKLKQMHSYIISDPSSESTKKLVETIDCDQPTSDCWEALEFFVDSIFCQFAGLFLPAFPLLVGFSIIFLI